MKRFNILLVFFLISFLWVQTSKAQNLFTAGLFPEAQLSYKLKKFSITHKIESQHGMFDAQRLNEELKYAHPLTDLQTFIGRRINPFAKIDIGYQYRIEEGENTHRPIQQISLNKQRIFFREGHRVRTDQTFFKAEPMLWRARYRYLAQIPLQGRTLDNGENYLTISNELIYMYQSGEDDLENRAVIMLGFYVNDKTKWEVGLDHRTDDYLVDDRFRTRLWLKFGFYKSL